MKKLLIGLLALGTLTASASGLPSCYFSYANKRLDTKMELGIATLGFGTLIDAVLPEAGIANSTELLTEAIAQNKDLAPKYLKEIASGSFGKRLEKIIKTKRTTSLSSLVSDLRSEGLLLDLYDEEAVAEVAAIIVKSIHNNQLCTGKLQNTAQIKNLITKKLHQNK